MTGYEYVEAEKTIAAKTYDQLSVYCPPGKVTVGGGYLPKFNGNPIVVYGFMPHQNANHYLHPQGYNAYARNPSTTTAWILIVRVVSANG